MRRHPPAPPAPASAPEPALQRAARLAATVAAAAGAAVIAGGCAAGVAASTADERASVGLAAARSAPADDPQAMILARAAENAETAPAARSGARAEQAENGAKAEKAENAGRAEHAGTARTAPAPSVAQSVRSTPVAPPAAAERPAEPPPPQAQGARDAVVAFAVDVGRRRGLDTVWILDNLAQARTLPSVQRLVMPPPAGTAKNWAAYRDRFVEPKRIAAGVAFWDAHEPDLARAEARWGVPAAVVVGVIGVETLYGRITGSFRIVDALSTLAFDFPAGRSDRSPFFRGELEEFLVWCAREGVDPGQPRGSYAGAIGLPQFMPGSINRFAVDFDGDGHVDLAASAADAIGSVANYLAAHGWQRGVAPTFAVAPPVDTAARARLLAPDIVPSFAPDELAAAGAELDAAGRRHGGKLALVELQNGDAAPSYVAGSANFYAITRYNQSSYYAMAVLTLGDAVTRARGAAGVSAAR